MISSCRCGLIWGGESWKRGLCALLGSEEEAMDAVGVSLHLMIHASWEVGLNMSRETSQIMEYLSCPEKEE